MKKVFLFSLAIMLLLPFACHVKAQTVSDTTADSTSNQMSVMQLMPQVTGYILFDPAVNKGDEHKVRNAVVKLKNNISTIGTWQFQYDLNSQYMIAARAEFRRQFAGGTIGANVGRTFSAAGDITPAPNGLYAPNWSSVYLPFTFLGDGLSFQYTKKDLEVYFASIDRLSAAVTYKGFETLWEDSVGNEVGYTTPYKVLGVHPSMKVLFFADHGKTQHASSFWVGLGHGLRFYQLSKWGRSEGYSAGLTCDVKNVRLKWFYDLTAERHFAEFVCSF